MRSPTLSILAVLTLLATGCGIPETVQRRSSLSAYLGAKPQPRAEAGTDPVKLQLPLRLGVAFVPVDLAQVKSAAAMDQLSTSLDQGVAAYDPTRR